MTVIKQKAVSSSRHAKNVRKYINGKDALTRGGWNLPYNKYWYAKMARTRKSFGHDKPARAGAKNTTMTCSKIPLYAMSFLPGAVTQKRFATVMPVPCQIMVRTMFVLPVRRERTLFSSRLLKAVALANRAIRMSSIK